MTPKEAPHDVIDDALQTYPLRPAPAALKTRVMRDVHSRPQLPVFAFPWLEASLSLLAAAMLTTAFYLAASVSPVELRLFAQDIRRLITGIPSTSLAAALGGLTLTVLCSACAAVLFASQRPHKVIRRALRR
jgi:hypothetical protein